MARLAPSSTVFVTGASGFVGSHAIKELVSHGYTVVGLARSDDAAAKIEQLGASTIRGTIEDLDVLKQAALKYDAGPSASDVARADPTVVHLGTSWRFVPADGQASYTTSATTLAASRSTPPRFGRSAMPLRARTSPS